MPIAVLQPIRRLLHDTYRALAPDCVVHGSAILPAKHLRFCGNKFKDDEYFLNSAKAEAERLVEQTSLCPQSRILDLGCGVGRLPLGIIAKGLQVGSYWGLDVDKRSICWCKEHIQLEHPKFQFLHTDVWSARYNPKGAILSATFRLPFDDQSFDIIYLYSVFSHMLTDDVRIYAGEFKRVLPLSGYVFLTAFVEDNVADVVENPVGYKMVWNSVLHCVRYNTTFLSQIFKDAGFQISNFVYGRETDGQSAIYLAPSEANP